MFEIIMKYIEILQSNPIVAGLFGTALLSGIFVWLRNIPKLILNRIYRALTTSISADELHDRSAFCQLMEILQTQKVYCPLGGIQRHFHQ